MLLALMSGLLIWPNMSWPRRIRCTLHAFSKIRCDMQWRMQETAEGARTRQIAMKSLLTEPNTSSK